MHIVLLMSSASLGQTNESKTIKALSDQMRKDNYFPIFSTSRLYATYIYDLYLRSQNGNIGKYKKGEITTEEFLKTLSWQLGISDIENTKKAWNAMEEISTEELTQDIELFKLQEKKQLDIGVISATNPLQWNSFTKQISDYLSNHNLSRLEDNDHFHPIVSFNASTLSYVDIAKKLIKEKGWDKSDIHIISLHNTLNYENLGLQNCSFTSITTSPKCEYVPTLERTANDILFAANSEGIKPARVISTAAMFNTYTNMKNKTLNKGCNIL